MNKTIHIENASDSTHAFYKNYLSKSAPKFSPEPFHIVSASFLDESTLEIWPFHEYMLYHPLDLKVVKILDF